jgi:ABC-2 type transport system permease protein
MPDLLYRISKYLPYYYQMYFPAAIFTGRIHSPGEAATGLLIQVLWLIVLAGIAKLLWSRGLRHHTAVGG